MIVYTSDFSQAIKFYGDGLQIGQLQGDDYLYPVIGRNSNTNPDKLAGLEESLVWSSSQRIYISFKQVSGKMHYASEKRLINRRDRVRTITVKAEAGYNETTGEAFNCTQVNIAAIALLEGYKLDWGGEYESSNKAQAALGIGLSLGFLIMSIISVLLLVALSSRLLFGSLCLWL